MVFFEYKINVRKKWWRHPTKTLVASIRILSSPKSFLFSSTVNWTIEITTDKYYAKYCYSLRYNVVTETTTVYCESVVLCTLDLRQSALSVLPDLCGGDTTRTRSEFKNELMSTISLELGAQFYINLVLCQFQRFVPHLQKRVFSVSSLKPT